MTERYEHILYDLNACIPPHQNWGFDVYWTSFQDEELWRRYLDYIRQAVTEASENDGEGQVAACATFHVKEIQPSDSRNSNSNSLEGLQPSEVRKCHMGWIASLKAKDPDASDQISEARRNFFFLLVNDDVLDKFRATEESGFHGRCGVPSYLSNDGVVIVVCEAEEDDERPYDDGPEGEMEWQYLDAFSITAMYELLCGSTEAYYRPGGQVGGGRGCFDVLGWGRVFVSSGVFLP
ncbi:hypothetical protein PG997_006471 [Apiospora hydei]|uniref:Uncharacterized protein n=1 Tax=Apiospora hydei TaxID=1337664 RepID=A0ABR1WNT0_9PEZI